MAIRTRNKVSVNFSMSGMTDVVFLLLIFFMITSTLVMTNTIEVKLPKSSPTPAPKTDNVAVSISPDLQHYVDREPVEADMLEARIKQAMAGKPGASILLNADKTVPLDNAVKILDIAYRNQYKIVLATSPK